MTSHYDSLINIFNDINIITINNNLIIKDKILKKIELIKVLSNNNIDVLNYNNEKIENLLNILQSINNKLMSVKKNHIKLNTQLNNILGSVIHNAYISSGYHVLLSNIPSLAKYRINNKINLVDSETIYDTIIHYIGNEANNQSNNEPGDGSGNIGFLKVIQIDTDKYLAKFRNINDAKLLCNLINKMMIETNIINSVLLEKIDNTDTIDTFDTIDTIGNYLERNNSNKITPDTKMNNTDPKLNNPDTKINNISLFNICINLAYQKYENIKNNINYSINYSINYISQIFW